MDFIIDSTILQSLLLSVIFLSILGTLYFIVRFFDVNGDVIILQKKK